MIHQPRSVIEVSQSTFDEIRNNLIANGFGGAQQVAAGDTILLTHIGLRGPKVAVPCGFVPPSTGYAACTRAKGHEGPCAHDFAPMPKDWRVGLSVKANNRSSSLYFEIGTVIDVHPNGTGGIFDPYGVLRIKIGRGDTMLVRASEWVIITE